ncbi:MAG: LysR family transcriptional regulator [Prolixibacteraceae bacterium]
MTLLQLSYVLELSQHRSFSIAAKRLEISQPALSLQISKLEEELGMLLFKRTPNQISPTIEGELFIEKTRELLQMAEYLKDLPFELENTPEGILRIGIIPTLAPYWAPMYMNDFVLAYPKIQLSIKELKTEEIISELRNGHLDAGFISTPVEAKGMDFRLLFYERFFLYVSEKHELFKYDSIDLDKVDLKEMWYLEEGNCFQNQVDSVCMYARQPHQTQNMVYLSNSIESLCRVVENSNGLTFIPELATLSVDPAKEDMIKEIAGTAPVREISLVTTKINKSDRLINLLLEKALEVIPKRMKQNKFGRPLSPGLKF